MAVDKIWYRELSDKMLMDMTITMYPSLFKYFNVGDDFDIIDVAILKYIRELNLFTMVGDKTHVKPTRGYLYESALIDGHFYFEPDYLEFCMQYPLVGGITSDECFDIRIKELWEKGLLEFVVSKNSGNKLYNITSFCSEVVFGDTFQGE